MKIAVAAFLFAKGNVNVNHKKSSEKNSELKFIQIKLILVSKSSMIDEVIEVVTKSDHKAVSSVSLDVRHSKVISSSHHKFVESNLYNW